MPASTRSKRVLLYSHDTFGLGHLRRCRTIANALVEADQSVSVLILSGSPIIGSPSTSARASISCAFPAWSSCATASTLR